MSYIKSLDKEDRLFLSILSIVLSIYFIISFFLFIHKREHHLISKYQNFSKKMHRITVDIPVTSPVSPAALTETEKIQDTAEEKKTEPSKKLIKKNSPSLISTAKPDNNRVRAEEGSDILKLIGSIDESMGGIESVEKVKILNKGDNVNKMSKAEDIFKDSSFKEIGVDIKDKERKAFSKITSDKADANKKGGGDARNIDIRYRDTVHDNNRSEVFLEKRIGEYAYGLKLCYDKSLSKKADIEGNILLKFTILSSGETSDIYTSGDINDKNMESCITGSVSRWRFPSAKSDKVVITYPLIFKITLN